MLTSSSADVKGKICSHNRTIIFEIFRLVHASKKMASKTEDFNNDFDELRKDTTGNANLIPSAGKVTIGTSQRHSIQRRASNDNDSLTNLFLKRRRKAVGSRIH